jgi:predicted molibdopterin-dependent oxidoreductase YjgC
VLYSPPSEVTDDEYPFVLTTGRNLFQYHSGSMTRRVAPIESHAGSAYAEINPEDAKRLSIKEGETVTIRSRRGAYIIARITPKSLRGNLHPHALSEAAANILTNDARPKVKIPEQGLRGENHTRKRAAGFKQICSRMHEDPRQNRRASRFECIFSYHSITSASGIFGKIQTSWNDRTLEKVL